MYASITRFGWLLDVENVHFGATSTHLPKDNIIFEHPLCQLALEEGLYPHL